MDAGAWFWIIYVLAVLIGSGCFYIGRPADQTQYRVFGGWISTTVLFFILFGLLGYRVFHGPVQ